MTARTYRDVANPDPEQGPSRDELARIRAAEVDHDFENLLAGCREVRAAAKARTEAERDEIREATRLVVDRCFLAFCVLCGVLLLSALFVPATRAALKAAQETPQP